jgi:diguanylate cyclase (GGDEF)-like protein
MPSSNLKFYAQFRAELSRFSPVDVFTLFFVEASLLFLFSLTMLAGSIGRSGKSGSYWFAASNFCGGVGLLLHCAIHSPSLINVVLANLFTFVELALLNKAIAEFVSRGRRVWIYLLALSVLMTVATVHYTLWPDDHSLRIVFISVIAIATAACSATLLFRSLREGTKTSTVVMAVLFCLYATTNTVRLLDVWSFPHQSFYHIWLDRTIIAALSFGFLWMTTTRLSESLERLAGTDALTGTLNRRAVERETVRVFSRSRERNDSISAIMLDIDRFKQINDGYGHQAGDLALCAVADCLRSTMRAGDLIARLGGDEFLVIMPNTNADAAQLAADRIQVQLAGLRVSSENGEFGLRASIGITSITGGNLTLEALLKLGDRALYDAKATSHREASAFAHVAP